LKKTDWPAIDYYLSKRKRDGKENEVLLNDVPIPPRKIRKEILRNSSAFPSKYSGEGKQFFTVDGSNGARWTDSDPASSPRLPTGVVIRTPPSSPAVTIGILNHTTPSAIQGIRTTQTSTPSLRHLDFYSSQFIHSSEMELHGNWHNLRGVSS